MRCLAKPLLLPDSYRSRTGLSHSTRVIGYRTLIHIAASAGKIGVVGSWWHDAIICLGFP